MEKYKFVYSINNPGELAAGIAGYNDEMTICSGDPGGESGEFSEYMRECIAEWFDGARVELVSIERKKAHEQDDQASNHN